MILGAVALLLILFTNEKKAKNIWIKK
jgi:hypothetical protein